VSIAIPNPYTWVNGEEPDFWSMESRVAKTIDFAMNPPFLRLKKTSTQSIPNTTHTAIIWDTVELESDNMWDAAQPTRIKPSTPGWYVGTTGFSFTANTTGYREMDVKKNNSGTDRVLRIKIGAFASGYTSVARGNVFLEQFNGTTDYIEVTIWQNTGANLVILFDSAEYQPDLVLRWVAPL
jgi:hypothetical protein